MADALADVLKESWKLLCWAVSVARVEVFTICIHRAKNSWTLSPVDSADTQLRF